MKQIVIWFYKSTQIPLLIFRLVHNSFSYNREQEFKTNPNFEAVDIMFTSEKLRPECKISLNAEMLLWSIRLLYMFELLFSSTVTVSAPTFYFFFFFSHFLFHFSSLFWLTSCGIVWLYFSHELFLHWCNIHDAVNITPAFGTSLHLQYLHLPPVII